MHGLIQFLTMTESRAVEVVRHLIVQRPILDIQKFEIVIPGDEC
jgi:hypothetical protein